MAKIKFGCARENIEPQVPCSLAGYFNARMWDRILDDIEVRALVIEKNSRLFCIIQFDLVTIAQTFADRIYVRLPDGFSAQNVIITATHSHTAPEIREAKTGYSAEYVDLAVGKAIEALGHAARQLEPGSLYRTQCSEARFSFNRRYWMKDGSVITNPPKLDPAIDRSEGLTDSDIPVLVFKDEHGAVKAVLANIVNHADTVGGNSVSADWPGITRRCIEKSIGGSAVFFPLIGCAGNINHLDISSPDPQFSYAETRRISEGYAQTIIDALDKLEPVAEGALKTAMIEVSALPREIDAAEIHEAEQLLQSLADVPDARNGGELHSVDLATKSPAALKYFASELLKVAEDKAERLFKLCAFSIGDAVVISLPAEPFVEIGLEIKKEIFPGAFTLVLSHSNGTGAPGVSGGYIPNAWNYGRGGYETTVRSSPFSMQTSEKLLDGVRQLKQLLQKQ